jgi:teichuronic acid biosynthesis glycosyltransferase TuaG
MDKLICLSGIEVALAKPRFSVITPVLNGVNYIDSYVRCLQLQTFTNWEAVVIDDGSTDGSVRRLQEATAADPRFRLARNTIPRKLPGPYQARNIGLSLARGEFVCFLDIDDCWLPNKLAFQNTHLTANPQTMLVYSAYIRARVGAITGQFRCTPTLLAPHCWVYFVNPVPMLTACVHRKIIAGVRFKPCHHEDYLFWHSIFQRLRPEQVAQEPYPLAIYLVHAGSLSANKFQAIGWIWQCYRQFGYTRLLAAAALFARGLFQFWLIMGEIFGHDLKFNSLEK